ncbi:MAG TPA: pilus assembly protein TadG-related protein [Candidatus Limnocylindria bacterium]
MDERGNAVLTIVLLPLFLVVLGGTFELGSLRVVAARAQTAADLAALGAMNDQDDAELRRSGRLRPSADAEAVARAILAENLGPVGATLSLSPAEIAARARVTVAERPPTVRIAATIPVRTPFFGALIARSSIDLQVRAAASAR